MARIDSLSELWRGLELQIGLSGRSNAYAQTNKTKIPQCMIFVFIEVRKDLPESLLKQAIAFFAMGLLNNSREFPSTDSNAVRY